MRTPRLTRSFFEQPTLEVAKALLGKQLVQQTATGEQRGIISETEAYISAIDPAAHGYTGLTPRCRVMAESGGHVYIYHIHRSYCFNVVTEPAEIAAAVLIRSVIPVVALSSPTNGPGKLCRAYALTTADNGRDLVTDEYLRIEDTPTTNVSYYATSRIGIRRAIEKPWRFILTSEATSSLKHRLSSV